MTDITEKQLLAAFEKALAEYEHDQWEVEFAQVFDSWDMFVVDKRFDQKAINHREFIRKMLGYLA